jgi:hypothetical protein
MNRHVLFITLLMLSAQSMATTIVLDSSEGPRTSINALLSPMDPL